MMIADARHVPLRPKSVQCIVTSPPYLEQRRYGSDLKEIGHEASVAAYATTLAAILGRSRGPDGCLADDGCLWLNLGEKANGSGGAGGDWAGKDGGAKRFVDSDYELGSFVDVPGAVVREMLKSGWRLRAQIVWDKGARKPESLAHANRPGISHEMIYLFAPTQERQKFYPVSLDEQGSVWHFPAGADRATKHLAPFPDELARRAILASTDVGDVVFDPFSGSGTTTRVAGRLGRVGIGGDLYGVSG